MKKLFVFLSLALACACGPVSPQVKSDVATGISVAEQACADAVALGVPDAALVCTGIQMTAPLVTAILDAQKEPAKAQARLASYRASVQAK